MVDSPEPADRPNDGTPGGDRDWDWHYAAALRWLAREPPHTVRLVCAEASRCGGTRRDPVVVLPCCIGDLPMYRVADFAARVETVHIALDDCADPEGAREWLARVPGPLHERVRPTERRPRGRVRVEVPHPPVDRRGLFGLSRDIAEVEHDEHDSDHRRLVNSLRRLGISGAGASDTGEKAPGLVLVASGCTACGVCVKACPTGALSLIGDGIRTLQHDRSVCEGHEQCIELCPESALTAAGHPDWPTVLNLPTIDLAAVPTRVCARCRDRFAGPGDMCPACQQRASDPFGVHLPPKAAELLRRRRASR